MHVWYVDAGIEDTPEPVYTHCLVLSCTYHCAQHKDGTAHACGDASIVCMARRGRRGGGKNSSKRRS